MASPLLVGSVRLRLSSGFEENGEYYEVTEGIHHIYESAGCSSLRVAPTAHLSETQIEQMIAKLVCTYTTDLSAEMSEPSISLVLSPEGDASLHVVLRHWTRNGIKITGDEHKVLASGDSLSLHDSHSIMLQLEAFGPTYPSFATDFSDVRKHERAVVIPSSDAAQEMNKAAYRSPTPMQKTVSFIKETPTASRYMDMIADHRPDNEELPTFDMPGQISHRQDDVTTQQSDSMHVLESETDKSRHDHRSPTKTAEDDLLQIPADIVPLPRSNKKKPKNYRDRRTLLDETLSPDTSRQSQHVATDSVVSEDQKENHGHKRKIREESKSEKRIKIKQNRDTKMKSSQHNPKQEVQANLQNTLHSQHISDVNNDPDVYKPEASLAAAEPLAEAIGSQEKRLERPSRGRPKKINRSASDQEIGAPISSSATSPRRSQRSDAKKATIAFSSSAFPQDSRVKKFFQNRMNIVDEVDATVDVLCIGSGKLVTTVKVLKAVLLGKPIVSDNWIEDSVAARQILDHRDYHFVSDDGDKNWSFGDGWSAGGLQVDVEEFKHMTLYVTPNLSKCYGSSNFAAVKELGMLLGFKNVTSFPASSLKEKANRLVALGLESGDVDAKLLQSQDIKVYHKDLLNASIFSGRLQACKEFLLPVATPAKARSGSKMTTRARRADDG